VGADAFAAAGEAIYDACVVTENETPLFGFVFSLLKQ
jgi:hypothetical protein